MKKPKRNIRKRHYRMTKERLYKLREQEVTYKWSLLFAPVINVVATMEDRRD